jgi:hypothetical protein
MNRGQDIITEPERIKKKLEQRLNETEEERLLLRQEREELNTTVKVLKGKRLHLNSYVSWKRGSLMRQD